MAKQGRLYLRLIIAFIKRFKLVLLFATFVGMFIFALATIVLPKFETNAERIGIIGEYSVTNLPPSISKMISTGLTSIDDSGRPIPAIASSWESSDSGKTWVFHINKNLKWQDGTEITSKDINYNFSDASIIRPNNSSIVFNLKTPLSNFPTTLSKPAYKQGLLGVGEWKVNNLSLAGTFIESLSIKNNKGNSKLFKFYPTVDRAKLAFELGQIDHLDNLISSDPFTNWKTVDVTKSINKNQYIAVFFNTTSDILADKEVRQALSYAIDKGSFTDSRALGPISPNSWAYNPSIKPYDFDLDHAKELINEAKISPDSKNNLKIKLTTVPDLLPLAEKIAKNWQSLGVKTTLQITSFVPDDYQAFLGIYDIPTDPDQYSIWHSTQTVGNITRYKNARIDKLLEDGRLETSEAKRKSIYFDFQKYLLEDAPAAFLYYPTYYSIQRK